MNAAVYPALRGQCACGWPVARSVHIGGPRCHAWIIRRTLQSIGGGVTGVVGSLTRGALDSLVELETEIDELRAEVDRLRGDAQGFPLELGRDDGGLRHFVAGRAVACGTGLEWNRGGEWSHVRYEASWTQRTVVAILCDDQGEHALRDTDRFRWPVRR